MVPLAEAGADLEFAIARLAPLADREQWEAKMRRLAGAAAGGG